MVLRLPRDYPSLLRYDGNEKIRPGGSRESTNWVLVYYLHQSLTSELFVKVPHSGTRIIGPELARADYFIPVDLMGARGHKGLAYSRCVLCLREVGSSLLNQDIKLFVLRRFKSLPRLDDAQTRYIRGRIKAKRKREEETRWRVENDYAPSEMLALAATDGVSCGVVLGSGGSRIRLLE
ncbi:hypothetical protein V1477_009165 [Vespula maculifrons]|uniref:Uncharacterized protein n=1 Tax=Vespula maculifrons TaxID=7453 RepID=A0ABD2CC90_VESMC